MKKLIFLVFWVVPFFVLASPGTPIDSLLQRLQGMKADTAAVKQLDMISYTYSRIDPDEGIRYAEKTRQLADSLSWKKGLASAYSDYGINYEAKSFHSNALYFDRKALEIYQQLGMQSAVVAVLCNISEIYKAQADYSNALEYSFRAMKANDESQDKLYAATIRENIGTISVRQKHYDDAMNYYSAALAIFSELKNATGTARLQGDIGIVYDEEGNYARALEYHRLSLASNQKANDRLGEQINLMNIGIVYCHLKDYDAALENQQQALAISQALKLESSISVNLGNLGETYFFIAADSQNQDKSSAQRRAAALTEAISNLENSLAICRKIGYLGPMIEFNQFLSDAYSLDGNYRKALEILRQNMALRDSVFTSDNLVKLSDLETRREMDIMDKEIEIRDKQLQIATLEAVNDRDQKIIYIAGITFLLTVVLFGIRRFIKKTREHETIMSDIASIQSHEIRGSVARILGLSQLLDYAEPGSAHNAELISHIRTVSIELDEKVKHIVQKSTVRKKRKIKKLFGQKKEGD